MAKKVSKKMKSTAAVVAYRRGTRVKAAVAQLLENTGRSRNGSASDYNYVRSVATFGNSTGFVTMGQLSILGRIYNRVMNNGKRISWKKLVD